jgi:hypothetical protein
LSELFSFSLLFACIWAVLILGEQPGLVLASASRRLISPWQFPRFLFPLGWCSLDCLSRACVQELKSLFWSSRSATGTCLALCGWENQIFIPLLFVGLQVVTHKVTAFPSCQHKFYLRFSCSAARRSVFFGLVRSGLRLPTKLAFEPRCCSSQALASLCAFISVLGFNLHRFWFFPDLLRVITGRSRYDYWVVGSKDSSFSSICYVLVVVSLSRS